MSLDQDQYWTDIEGVTHRLEDMDYQYRQNVILFLKPRATYWYLAERIQEELWDPWDARETWVGIDDPAMPLMVQIEYQINPPNPADVMAWLEAKPLMRRLRELNPPTKVILKGKRQALVEEWRNK